VCVVYVCVRSLARTLYMCEILAREESGNLDLSLASRGE